MSKEEILTKLAEAEAELRAETAREKEVTKLREAMVIAVLDYARAAGIVPEDFSISAETMTSVLQSIKDMEDELRVKIGFIFSMTKAVDKIKDVDDGEVIRLLSMPDTLQRWIDNV